MAGKKTRDQGQGACYRGKEGGEMMGEKRKILGNKARNVDVSNCKSFTTVNEFGVYSRFSEISRAPHGNCYFEGTTGREIS